MQMPSSSSTMPSCSMVKCATVGLAGESGEEVGDLADVVFGGALHHDSASKPRAGR